VSYLQSLICGIQVFRRPVCNEIPALVAFLRKAIALRRRE
jgi:hypothetical protein